MGHGVDILALEAADNCHKCRLGTTGCNNYYLLIQDFQDFTISKNRESLAIVESMLDELGHRYVKSNANFTFIYTGRDVREVSQAFRAENIMVGRPFLPMEDWLRVSMAKPYEMEYFVQVYNKILG